MATWERHTVDRKTDGMDWNMKKEMKMNKRDGEKKETEIAKG